MTHRSLSFRLWLTILIAVVPIFLFALFDYQERRATAVADIRNEITQRLESANHEARAAHRDVMQTLRLMARSNELQGLDPEACSGIAHRMLESMEGFSNIGAALPDGTVFCSAQAASRAVNVRDRAWFRYAIEQPGISPGEFIIGRISGKPGVVFGYRLATPDGSLRAVLFASITLAWFDRLVEGFRLPPDWEASVIGGNGLVLAHKPDPARWREYAVPPPMLERMAAVVDNEAAIAEFPGLDGAPRLFGVSTPEFSPGNGFIAIGAPLEHSLDAVDRRFQLYMAFIAAVVLASAMLARFYVYRLIEVWTTRVRAAVARIAEGSFGARVGHRAGVHELDALADGIDHMAIELEKRDAELRKLTMVIEQSPESIVITDTAAEILYVNDAFERVTGYTREEVLGGSPRILNKGLTPKATYDEMWAALTRGDVWRGEFRNTRKDGSTYLELATVAPIKDLSGTVTHYVAVKEDITHRKQSEALLHRLAYYDALTELPNRALLHDRIAQAIRTTGRSESYGMLMLVDIDRFRQLNDTVGHAAGDRLLRAVGQRLRASVREEDTVARHGDDDFAVLIEHIGDTESEALAHAEQVVRKIQRALEAPYALDEEGTSRHFATLSMGISLFFDKETALDVLLKQAEVALYRAKQDGRNDFCFFSPEMQAVVDAHARLEARLNEAIAAEAFQLYYQPQVDRHGKVVGAEALLRWPVEGGKMISPAEFIPLAEDTGQILPLGSWVLRTACAQLARWQQDERTRDLTIAVNVSARQFHQPDFVASVTRAVSEAGIDASALELELTESAILSDLDETVSRMNQLRQLGIKFALDDFGTGYSSLSYLKRLPFAQLKIDQSFIRDMAEDESSEAIVLAILSMSHALGMEVVAEGVETSVQRQFLSLYGCEFFQGYLFGRPMPIDAWAELLARD